MENFDDALDEIAKEYASKYPYFVANGLGEENVSLQIVQEATKRIVCPLILSAFVMTIKHGESPSTAHEWFMSVLSECGKAIEEELCKAGMNTKVDVSGTFIRKEEPRDESSHWG
jgi:hypothetical protein